MNVADLIAKQFGIMTRANRNPLTDQVDTDVIPIMRNNPNRLAFLVCNLSANTVYIAFDRGVGADHGIALQPNGGSVSLLWFEDFESVCWEVFAVASGAASDIYVLEVLIALETKEVIPV